MHGAGNVQIYGKSWLKSGDSYRVRNLKSYHSKIAYSFYKNETVANFFNLWYSDTLDEYIEAKNFVSILKLASAEATLQKQPDYPCAHIA